jgi:tripeptidyl-peptidase-2
LEARIETLKQLDKNYDDPGLIFDCVVYFDGENWRAVIDVQESGDLTSKK